MADLVKIPLDRDIVHSQILTARLRAAGFELEFLDYRGEGADRSVLPHLLVHAEDANDIRAFLAAEEEQEQAAQCGRIETS